MTDEFEGYEIPEQVLMAGTEPSGWEKLVQEVKDAIRLPPY